MKILLYTDVHFSQYSSILRTRGEKFSTRLNYLIDSLNWAENLALLEGCKAVFCLGDFFDRAEINSEEASALNEVQWSGLSHMFVCGNHELGRVGNEFSSAHVFNLLPNTIVVDKPTNYQIEGESTEIAFLPYTLGIDKPIAEYFTPLEKKCDRRIIFSHNDLKGVQMGEFISTSGFEISDIEANCDLFLNGHLHNGMPITKKVINLGNLSGQNFSEDALKYGHYAYILDTETLQLTKYENPKAFNFYKLNINDASECEKKFSALKPNSVITCQCFERDSKAVQEWLENIPTIMAHRLIVVPEKSTGTAIESTAEVLTKVDHIQTFISYAMQTIGTDEVTLSELEAIKQ